MDAARRSLLLATAGLVVLPGAAQAARRETRWLFGSPAELILPAETPLAAAQEVWAGLSSINARWNAWKPGEVDELNRALRSGRPHRVPLPLRRVLQDAVALERASLGYFNPAIGGIVGAWGFHDDVMRAGPRPPADALARWTDARPTLASLQFDGHTVHGVQRQVQVDLGGYAKGVAIDWAFELLQRRGVRDGLLNLGGNLAVRGTLGGQPWRIGIRDPHGEGLFAQLAVSGPEAVVTSGTYERWRLLDDGSRCHHVIDPGSGLPAEGLASVTVLHRSAAVADAAATALLAAGPARWRQVARHMGVEDVLVIDHAGRHTASPRLAARLARA